jgi:two-component system cell cycle sensor histidine kinase/response regulator CckA
MGPEIGRGELPPRLLIIDDEPAMTRSLARVFSDFTVHTANAVGTAIEILRRIGGADAILCDFLIPPQDGADLYEAVAREWPGLEERIVFMTGSAALDRAEQFLATVPNPRIEKPFELRAVRALVSAAASR